MIIIFLYFIILVTYFVKLWYMVLKLKELYKMLINFLKLKILNSKFQCLYYFEKIIYTLDFYIFLFFFLKGVDVQLFADTFWCKAVC